jgi:hypothetical protein
MNLVFVKMKFWIKGGIVMLALGRVCLSLMARTKGGVEGEKYQEEAQQCPLDHRSKGPSTKYSKIVGSF